MLGTVRKAHQTLKLESLSHLQEPVEVVLEDLDLSLVDVVQDKLELGGADPVKTEERVGVSVLLEDVLEVRTAGGEDDPVGGDLVLVVTDQGHVIEILLTPQSRESLGNIGLEIIPLQTELLGHVPCCRSRL